MSLFLLIFFFLLVVYAFLIDYYRRGWNQIPLEQPHDYHPATKLSVIIAARNEEENIDGLIDSLKAQDYPADQFEVIIVDDHSTDASWQKLQDRQNDFLQLRSLRLSELLQGEQTQSFKKKAIEVGIAAATGTLIVTTDADCRFHVSWLKQIAGFHEQSGSVFIAAPVAMRRRKGLLAIFQALDFMTLQGITGASVFRRFHTMCNGANLAYTKDVFIEVNGFSGIDHIPSGDDMLLMHKIYRKYPDRVSYLKSREAIVVTEPAKTWAEFFHQRIRWASKAVYYEDKRIFRVLLLVYVINTAFLVLGLATIWESSWLFFLILLFIAKLLIEFPFVNSIAIFFGQTRLMPYFPLLQPFHILYTVIAGWLGRFGSYHWKGRKITNKRA